MLSPGPEETAPGGPVRALPPLQAGAAVNGPGCPEKKTRGGRTCPIAGQDAPRARHRGALVRNGIGEEFGPQAFAHDAENDVRICPAGERLERGRSRWKNGARKVRDEAAAEVCAACPHRRDCRGRAQGRGRWGERTGESKAMRACLKRMASPQGRQLSRQRSRYGEFPQLQRKGAPGLRRFPVGGWRNVRQEGMLRALACHGMQWIRLVWRKLESAPPALAAATCRASRAGQTGPTPHARG